jgi:hypothetical protein
MPHARQCRPPARTRIGERPAASGPHAREPVILSARHITLPDLLRHIDIDNKQSLTAS